MKDKSRYLCIPVIVLSVLAFISAIPISVLAVGDIPGILAGVFMLISVVFAVLGMIKSPYFSIGHVVIGCICLYLCDVGSAYFYDYYLRYLMSIPKIFISVSAVLSLIYVFFGICRTEVKKGIAAANIAPQQPVATPQNAPQNEAKASEAPNIANCALELEEYKQMLDNGILTEEEFSVFKAKIMKKYGFGVENVKLVPVDDSAKIDGKYDMGSLVLSIADGKFAFSGKTTNRPVVSGSCEYNADSVRLVKQDGTAIALTVNQDGNLVSTNGAIYPKM